MTLAMETDRSSKQDDQGDPGDKTDSYRTGFGDLFAGLVLACGPDGTGDGHLSLSSELDDPGDKTDSYRTECGDLFASVVSAGGTADDYRHISPGLNDPGNSSEKTDVTSTGLGVPVISVLNTPGSVVFNKPCIGKTSVSVGMYCTV